MLMTHILKRLSHPSAMRGFTLIEAMLTMVIASVAILALQSFYTSILQSEALAESRITAVHLAEQIIESWQQANTAAPPPVQCVNGLVNLQLNLPTPCIVPGSNDTAFTITATINPAKAPMPQAGGVAWANLPGVTDPYGVVTNPDIRVVTIEWQHRGEIKRVMLTHLARVP